MKSILLKASSFFLFLIVSCTQTTAPITTLPQTDTIAPSTWLAHMENDLIPFWTSKEALGEPVGNYPTVRGFDGRLIEDRDYRLPRMMGRQIFFYCAAFMMTGREELLTYAKAGVDWLIDYGWDKVHGGWYASLEKDGSPGLGPKATQDMAYAAQGLAAYFFVTRDKKAEEYLLKTRDLVFDPNTFWDAKNKRIKDSMDYKLTKEIDQEGGGWELVALLDQINAYMMATAPLLTLEKDRVQWATDMKTLSETLVKDFWQDGIFWGQKNKVGKGGRHVDFGHTFKTYWMLYLLNQNYQTDVGSKIFTENVPGLIKLAFDKDFGLWASGPRNRTEVSYGSSWWIFAECDQIAMTLNMAEKGSYQSILSKTLDGWLKYYVDKKWGEVFPGISRDGSAGFTDEESTGKVWDWKNGFHSAEHALIAYIHACVLSGQPLNLYFAAEKPESFVTKPYLFPGKEISREIISKIQVGEKTLTKIKASLSVDLRK